MFSTPRRSTLLLAIRRLAAIVAPFGLVLLPWHSHTPGPAPETAPTGRPRLAVLVVFDQLRGDYLERWHDLFGDGGFRRIEEEGTEFRHCHYPYADTRTGPGHASMVTGCSPNRHGVTSNDWYSREAGEPVFCVGGKRYHSVPKDAPGEGGSSPEWLLAPTLGDALKEASDGRGRVVALSLKSHAAALLGGQRPDACYWFDTWTGRFMTSSYYRDAPHPWLRDFNDRRPADRWLDKPWDRFQPDLDYERHSGPDNVAAEGKGWSQGRTFPHPLTIGPGKPDRKYPKRPYYRALVNSPFGNELLLDLVKRAIVAERLGADDVPDLLCVSFSSNDSIGHCWGPDSQEVLDVTLRSDRLLRELLEYLDAHVGRGRYVLAMTADHGVCPLPEVARAQGQEAGRVPDDVMGREAEAFLRGRFGVPEGEAAWIEWTSTGWIYLHHNLLRQRGVEAAVMEEALAGWLRRQPGIQTAYTRTQLLGTLPYGDAVGQMVQRSFHLARSGDVTIVLKPYHLLGSGYTGTSHGSPHAYDTHVPLLVFGPGFRNGPLDEAVTPQAIASILARAVGVSPPAQAEAPFPEGLRAGIEALEKSRKRE